ncbi:MAG TPA: hypothetical protein VGK38_09140 [Prolixibacteraceae bacterium]
MGKVPIAGIFSTIYTDPEKQDCKQASVTIKGQTGKQIKLEGLGLDLQVTKAGIEGTSWITANGVQAASWSEKDTKYQPKTEAPNLLLKDGENLLLNFYIRTVNESSRARMTNLSYTYSLVDVLIDNKTPAAVWIPGITKTQADEIVKKLKTDYPEIGVYIQIGD